MLVIATPQAVRQSPTKIPLTAYFELGFAKLIFFLKQGLRHANEKQGLRHANEKQGLQRANDKQGLWRGKDKQDSRSPYVIPTLCLRSKYSG
ncbi:MAG: hypothetical protein HRU09_07270 [Oligoflexales bacterium]|nr:hypothetical protein [Oligoflexales bacterium]